MYADVEINDGGQQTRIEKMKLKFIKDFSDNVSIYENEDGRAVLFYRNKNKYMLISIDMA